MKFKPPALPKKISHNEKIVELITLDPKLMEEWADDSATLYVAAGLYYYIRKAVMGSGNMKETSKMF